MANAVELLISAKNQSNAAFDALLKQLDQTTKKSKETGDAAKKLDKDFQSTSARAGQFADAVGKTTNTLARSADAFGLSAGAMRTIGDVADVAQLGFENMSKSAAGFNAASLGVVGAGLAIGTVLGKLILQIPGVTEAMDDLAAGAVRLFGGGIVQSTNEIVAANKNWAIEQKKVNAAYEDLLRSQTKGLTAEEARLKLGMVTAKHGKELIIEEIRLRKEKSDKAEAFALKEAIAFDQANQKAEAELKASLARQEADRKAYTEAVIKESYRLEDTVTKVMEDMTKRRVQGLLNEQLAYNQWVQERIQGEAEVAAAARERQEETWRRELDLILDTQNAINMATDLLRELGVTGFDALFSILDGWTAGTRAAVEFAKATNGAQQAMAAMSAASAAFKSGGFLGGAATGAAFGAQFGIVGAAIGGLAGGLLGLFGGAKKAREEMEKLRAQFIQSQGGLAALKQKANEAGISLDAMFRAKSAKELQNAIAAISGQLDVWQQAQDGVKDAAERYGLTIGELGPKFAQQELDKMALQLIKDYELLKASGADMVAVIAKMGPEFSKYVDAVVSAGGEIPKSMKPVIDQLYEEGKLVHENGEAYTEAEYNALKYGETQSEMFQRQIDLIERMVAALEHMAGINPTVNIHTNYTSSGHPGKPGENMPEFATGGVGNFGAGTPAMLHNMEAVLPLSNPQAMKMVGTAVAAAMAPMFAQTMMSNNNRGATRGDVNLDGLKVGTWLSGAARRGVVKGPPMGRRRRSQ